MRRVAGFTLIELVVTMVILSIVGVVTSRLISSAVERYQVASATSRLAGVGRLAVERIGREIRNAMPESIRVTNDGACVEFLSIQTASRYLDGEQLDPDGSSADPFPVNGGAAAASQFSVVIPFPDLATPSYVAVSPNNSAQLYASNNALVGFAGSAAIQNGTGIDIPNVLQINLDQAFRFPQHSPRERVFFLLDETSYCLVGDRLQRFVSYGLQAAQPNPPAVDSDLLLPGVGPISARVFDLAPPNGFRGSVLQIRIRLTERQQSVNLEHDVGIRNAL